MAWYSGLTNILSRKSKIDELQRTSGVGVRVLDVPEGSINNLEQKSKIKPRTAALLYSQSPYVNAAANIIAGSIASLDLNVYLEDANGVRKKIRKGYPYKTLMYINEEMTPYQFKFAIASWLVLSGEAFIGISTKKINGKKELILEVLDNQYVTVEAGTQSRVESITYSLSNEQEGVRFEKGAFIHIRTFAPDDYWRGHCNLNALEYDIAIERYLKKGLNGAFSKINNIQAILYVPQDMPDDEVSTIYTEINNKFSGYATSFKILVARDNIKYENTKVNNLPMGFEETKVLETSERAHAMVLGVPIGILEGSSGEDKLIELESLMWKKTIIPMTKLIQESLTKHLAQRENVNYVIEFDTSDVEALSLYKLERTRMQVARVITGLRTPNEERISDGEQPYSDTVGEGFGSIPRPVYDNQVQLEQSGMNISPSLSMPGTQGGRRDQSSTGEAQMIDVSGQKMLELLNNILNTDDKDDFLS